MLDSLSTYEIFLGRGFSETNITFWGSFKWPLPFERHYTRSGEEVISSDDDNDKHDDNDKDNDNGDSNDDDNGFANDKNHEMIKWDSLTNTGLYIVGGAVKNLQEMGSKWCLNVSITTGSCRSNLLPCMQMSQRKPNGHSDGNRD